MSESLPVQVEETKVSDEDGVKEKAEAAEGSAMQVDTDVTGEPQQQPSGEPGDKEKSATVDINTLTPSTPSQTPPQLLVGETTASGTTAVIPENILSPPKSETQTDETNTATSTSCSPASEGQRSPVTEQQPPPPQASTPPKQEQPETAAAATTVNGTIPKSGKPVSSALSAKKTSKAASTSPRASRARKPKALPMYESEISDHKVGIKLCIKKSDAGDSAPAATSPPYPFPRPQSLCASAYANQSSRTAMRPSMSRARKRVAEEEMAKRRFLRVRMRQLRTSPSSRVCGPKSCPRKSSSG